MTDWHVCLACETAACKEAVKLADNYAGWSRRMHQRLKMSQYVYICSTPAPAEAVLAAKRFGCDTTFARHVTARAEAARRADQLREIVEAVEEARRPKPMTERERKIQDIARWAAEARQQ